MNEEKICGNPAELHGYLDGAMVRGAKKYFCRAHIPINKFFSRQFIADSVDPKDGKKCELPALVGQDELPL